jgi:hypothetical protein
MFEPSGAAAPFECLARGESARKRALFKQRLEHLAIDLDLLDDVGPLDAILATEPTRSRYGKTDPTGLAVSLQREGEPGASSVWPASGPASQTQRTGKRCDAPALPGK